MRTCLLLVLSVCLGCGGGYPSTALPKEGPHYPPVKRGPTPYTVGFRGARPARPIGFDLAGKWSVFRFGTRENPGKLGPWSATWNLVLVAGVLPNKCWDDSEGQGRFCLSGPSVPQTIMWIKANQTRWWFFVNESSFGSLMMTGDDGEHYHAVRTEGGEGK